MAKFDIQYTNKSLPETANNVVMDIDTRTGAGQIGQGVQQLASTVSNIAGKYAIIKADTELSEAKMATERLWNEKMIALEGNLDPDTYMKTLDDFESEVQSIAPKMFIANKEYKQYLNNSYANREGMVKNLQNKRVESNFETAGFELLTAGDYSGYRKHVEKGKILKIYSPQQAEDLINEANKRQVFSEAMALPEDKGRDHIMKSDLETNDKQSIMDDFEFEHEQTIIEQKKKEEEVAKQAMALMVKGDLNGAKDILKANIENFDTDWFIDELNKIQNASRILADTGKNIYTDTQNWSLYWDDMQKAIDGKLTEQESRSHVGVDGYSISEYEKITETIGSPTSQDFENTKAAKVLKDLVKGMDFPDDNEKLILTEKGYRLLEDAIRNPEKPLTERQKVEKAIEIFNGLDEMGIEIFPESIKTLEELNKGRRKVWNKQGDKKVITQDGIYWLIKKFNGNEQEIRDYANKNGLTIP